MNTLDGHFLKEWIKPVLSALVTFVLLFLLVDIFGLVQDLIEDWPGYKPVLRYLTLRSGYATFFLSPMALLLGSFWMSHSLRYRKEWPVSLLSGRHPLYLLRLPLTAMILYTAGLVGINIYVMPSVASQINQLSDFTFENKTQQSTVFRNIHLRLIDGRTVRIDQFSPSSNYLEGLMISQRKNSSLKNRIDAKSGKFTPKSGWRLNSTTIRTFRSSGKPTIVEHDSMVVPLPPPEVLKQILQVDPGRTDKNPVEYSYENLKQSITFKQNRRMNAAPEKIYLHWKYGFPLTNPVLGLLGFLIGFRSKLDKTRGIGVCLLLGFSYWIFFNLSISLGKSVPATGMLSNLPPFLYVYLPSFLTVGFVLSFFNRRYWFY